MKQSTFLISRFLIEEYPVLKNLTGDEIRNYLHRFLRDPALWKKIQYLKSDKYTKQYQAVGQELERYDFYPYPEDWCFLSILSNGTGFSRCYIFVHLLRYEIGDLSLDEDGTPDKDAVRPPEKLIFCTVILDKIRLEYHRINQTHPPNPAIPQKQPVKLYKT